MRATFLVYHRETLHQQTTDCSQQSCGNTLAADERTRSIWRLGMHVLWIAVAFLIAMFIVIVLLVGLALDIIRAYDSRE
jgi:hypothetical protein